VTFSHRPVAAALHGSGYRYATVTLGCDSPHRPREAADCAALVARLASYSCDSDDRSTDASAFTAGAFDAGAARALVSWSPSPLELATPALATAQQGPVLLISSVTKRWPRQATAVLEDIDLELGAGELCWLTGENGAGKTTLLRIIAGIISPDNGRIAVCGVEARSSRLAYQQQIGLLTAGNSGLFARMTARQNLDYWARLAFVPRGQRSGRVDEAIERFGISALAGRRTDRMSMGQRQRVRIALAFLHRPALILLDEPVNSLDDEGCAVLAGALDDHKALGGSALWCSPGGDKPGVEVERRLQLFAGALRAR